MTFSNKNKSKDIIEINSLKTNTFLVDQQGFLSIKEHESVGIVSKASSNDESIISFVKSEFTCLSPLAAGKRSGDGGLKTYVFKANKSSNFKSL